MVSPYIAIPSQELFHCLPDRNEPEGSGDRDKQNTVLVEAAILLCLSSCFLRMQMKFWLMSVKSLWII